MIEYLPWSKKVFKEGLEKYTEGKFSILDIELGGQCNYRCIYCDSPYRERESKVSIGKIEEVLKNKVSWVFICGLGEPTAKGNIDLLISILKLCLKHNTKCSCFTNLSNLTPELENFIKQGVLHLLFKYDSNDESIVNNLYGTEKGGNQILNIERIKKLVKVENGCVNIAASIVPTQKNKNEIFSIVKDCHKHNIFPLIAELENSGSAQECYNELALSKEELTKIKAEVNEIIGEEYIIPICPAVICGVHIKCDSHVTLDSQTGLSCHWFWLEEPKTINIGNFNSLDFSDISKKITDYRNTKIDNVRKIYQNRNNLVFGGCGGDAANLLSKYIELIEKRKIIYLDNNATTQLSDSVIKTIELSKHLFANPSSLYSAGKEVKKKIEEARKNIASLINADSECLIFTGCATESNNAVFHSCTKLHPEKKHIIISSVEHPSIAKTVESYEKNGYEITRLKVDEKGRLNIQDLTSAIKDNTLLVSIMMANNEIGNIYPIERIVQIVKEKNSSIVVHTDAVQAIGKMEVNIETLGVDFMSISGHKFHAPKGVGCLYIRNIGNYIPFLVGGEQENELRSGTENTISILAMGQAAIDVKENLRDDMVKMKELRDHLEHKFLNTKGYTIKIIGDVENRICNTSCLTVDNVIGYNLVEMLDSFNKEKRICISAGSACNSKEQEPSMVMKSLGVDSIPIRISLSRYTTREEINEFYKYTLMVLKLTK